LHYITGKIDILATEVADTVAEMEDTEVSDMVATNIANS
jgi:hypothetical protein